MENTIGVLLKHISYIVEIQKLSALNLPRILTWLKRKDSRSYNKSKSRWGWRNRKGKSSQSLLLRERRNKRRLLQKRRKARKKTRRRVRNRNRSRKKTITRRISSLNSSKRLGRSSRIRSTQNYRKLKTTYRKSYKNGGHKSFREMMKRSKMLKDSNSSMQNTRWTFWMNMVSRMTMDTKT